MRSIRRVPCIAFDANEYKQAFDKVTVLYEGRQIYFGSTRDAKAYFENLGFDCELPRHENAPCDYTPATQELTVSSSRPGPTNNCRFPDFHDLAERTPDSTWL